MKTWQMAMTVFDKEPSALDSNEAGFLLEMLEAGREDNTSATRAAPGSAARTRTPTVCYASTFRRAPT